MARRRPRIAAGWSGQFSREPEGVYQAKEKERAVALIQTTVGKVMDGFAQVAAPPPLPKLGDTTREAFTRFDREMNEYEQAGLPPLPTAKNDNGWMDRFKSASGTALKASLKSSMAALNAPAEYVGQPLFANISGATSARRTEIMDAQGNPTGQFYREEPGWGDAIQSIGSAFKDPVGAYKEGRQAFDERLMNQDLSAGHRVVLSAAADPLTLAGPGVVKSGMGLLPAGLRASRIARITGSLIESPSAVVAGSVGGAVVAAEQGENIPGFNRIPEEYQPLAGGLIGGVSPSVIQNLARRRPSLAGAFEGDAPVTAVTRQTEPGERFFHGTTEEFDGMPRASGSGSNPLHRGLYTGPAETASRYAPNEVEGGRVYPLEARNPGGARLLQALDQVLPEELEAVRGALTPDQRVKFDRSLAQLRKDAPDYEMSGEILANIIESIDPFDETLVPAVLKRAGMDGLEGPIFGGKTIQSWADPDASLRSSFDRELPELPSGPQTVKRPNLFGDVEDTFQTEAEPNGWKATQGSMFDRNAFLERKPKIPTLPGQRSIFDVLDESDAPTAGVHPRRQRMADVEGNDIVRMRGDQIAEALGLDGDFIRRYRSLDNLVRNPDGSPNKKHPQWEEREAVRQELTRMYVARTGRQPVFVRKPGERAERYADIDARVSRGEAFGDTGGEFEGYFDTSKPRTQRIMDLEKIADDPNATPQMRERARQKLLEESGAELTGREPGDMAPPRGEYADGENMSLGQVARKSYVGSTSPAGLLTRAAAGFVSAKAEGEDNSEAFKRSVLGILPGAVTRTALRTTRDTDMLLGAVARGEDAAGDGPKIELDPVRLKHTDIQEMPELFQGRDADPGLTYKESRVQSIVENFDVNRLEPGLVVRDVNTGQHVVLRGHHRLEAMKRKAAAGELPEESSWQVVEADLSNPKDVADLRKMAQLSNFGTAEPNLRERIRTVRVLQEAGDTPEAIQGQMRLSSQEYDDLANISATFPDDLVDRITDLPKGSQEAAAEVARVAAVYDFKEKDIRALLARYVFNPERARTRGQVRTTLEAVSRAHREAQERGLQGALFDEDEIETILRQVDMLKEKEDAILREKRSATTLIRKLEEFRDDPELEGAADALRRNAEAKIVKLEGELEDLRRGFNEERLRKMSGDDIDELPEAPPDFIPQTGPGLFGDDMPAALPELPQPATLPDADAPAQRPVSPAPSSATSVPSEELRLEAGVSTGRRGPTALSRAPEGVAYSGSERPPVPGSVGSRDRPFEELEPIPDLPGASPQPAGYGADERPLGELLREFSQRTGDVPSPAGGVGREFPELTPQGGGPGPEVPTSRGAFGQEFPELIPAGGRVGDVPTSRGASEREFTELTPAGGGTRPPVPPGGGRFNETAEFGDFGEGPMGPREPVPGRGNDPRQGRMPTPESGPDGRYRAEIDDAEARRINEDWANLGKSAGDGTAKPVGEGRESGGWVDKVLVEWPVAASRAAFTAATSGDIGSGLIQSAYLAWTRPREWARSMARSIPAGFSQTRREGAREYVRQVINSAAPADMADDLLYKRAVDYGLAIATKQAEMSGDIGSQILESKKLHGIGTFFRGTRRQFETQTEHMRATAFTDIIRRQRSANIANGLGDVLLPDQIRGAVNVANHITGATKLGMHPAASVAFGAPRFLISNIALIQDAFRSGSVSASYARREMIKSLGMIATATGVANLAFSGGKDFFGPGLGRPDDIRSWEDFKEVVTSPNFGRVRVHDSDISLFGPLDPMARAFWKELANIPEVLTGSDDAKMPGTDVYNMLENKASPLARAILDTAAGENKFTGKEYNNFGDWLLDNSERVMPIWAQNSLDVLRGEGDWLTVGAEFVGLKASPTTPYERAVGILDSIPGEYWVVDAKTNQLRPPADVYELTAKQRTELRAQYPEIDKYLRRRETDPDRPFMAKLTDQYVNAQTYWDAELQGGKIQMDEWRRQFISNQRQLRVIREANPASATYEASTQGEQDLDDYFAIWDDQSVDTEQGLNYEAADQRINALRSRIGTERWEALKETLAWNKSPVVTQYLTDMQIYNDFLANNPKYVGVDASQTRAVDRIAQRVRQMQAANPGLPGKYALFEMQEKGEIDADMMFLARQAIGRKYTPEYESFRATEEGTRVTNWFKPVLVGEETVEGFPESGGGSGGITLRSSRSRTSGTGSNRRRLIAR